LVSPAPVMTFMDTICLARRPYLKLLMPQPPVEIQPPTVETCSMGTPADTGPLSLPRYQYRPTGTGLNRNGLLFDVEPQYLAERRQIDDDPGVGRMTPPNPHDAAPLAITGTLRSFANARTFLISSALLGWTTKSGCVLKNVPVMIGGTSPMS